MAANVHIQQILVKRGNTAQIAAYTGPMGEPVYNIQTRGLHIQDGVTPGGHLVTGDTTPILANLNVLQTEIANIAGITGNVLQLHSFFSNVNLEAINTAITSLEFGTYTNANTAAFLPHYAGTVATGNVVDISGVAINVVSNTGVQLQYDPQGVYNSGIINNGSWAYLDSTGFNFQSNTTGTWKTVTLGNDGSITTGGDIRGDGIFFNPDLGESFVYMDMPNNTNANTSAFRLGNDRGNITIGTSDGTHFYNWAFVNDGQLTLSSAGNIASRSLGPYTIIDGNNSPPSYYIASPQPLDQLVHIGDRVYDSNNPSNFATIVDPGVTSNNDGTYNVYYDSFGTGPSSLSFGTGGVWHFGQTGTLTLPGGGDIVDRSTGNSVINVLRSGVHTATMNSAGIVVDETGRSISGESNGQIAPGHNWSNTPLQIRHATGYKQLFNISSPQDWLDFSDVATQVGVANAQWITGMIVEFQAFASGQVQGVNWTTSYMTGQIIVAYSGNGRMSLTHSEAGIGNFDGTSGDAVWSGMDLWVKDLGSGTPKIAVARTDGHTLDQLDIQWTARVFTNPAEYFC